MSGLPGEDFDCTKIPDDVLALVRRLCLGAMMKTAPKFAQWLHRWCDTEQYFRHTDPDNRPEKHLRGVPPLLDFSDAELAGALRAAVLLSYHPMAESLAQMTDRILLGVMEVATERLEARSDAVR